MGSISCFDSSLVLVVFVYKQPIYNFCKMYTTPVLTTFCIQYIIIYLFIVLIVHCTVNYVWLLFRPIDGVSTYNVVPFEAGQYFNKIQCFCFEEQRLNPGEEVRMNPPNHDSISVDLCLNVKRDLPQLYLKEQYYVS